MPAVKQVFLSGTIGSNIVTLTTFFILMIIGCGTQNPTKQSIVIEFNCVSKQSEFEQKDYTA